jgi:hypothetical protein
MMKGILAVALILVVLAVGCTEHGEKFDFKETDLSYIEFVREEPESFEEYIIHSNGLVLEKKAERIRIGHIDGKRAVEIIERAGDGMKDTTEGIDCEECGIYHVFYGSPRETLAYTVRMDEAPQYVLELEEETKKVADELVRGEAFYVHFVYKRTGEYVTDYHFYPDGTTLLEEFGPRNGELKNSRIYRLEREVMERIKREIPDEYFTSENDLMGCNSRDLEWGYLEIQKDGRYGTVYTCGTGNTAADELFNEFLEKTT